MEQIINMIMRQLTRRFVNIGIEKSINAVSKKMKPETKGDDQPPLR
jgi:hypothetical protein